MKQTIIEYCTCGAEGTITCPKCLWPVCGEHAHDGGLCSSCHDEREAPRRAAALMALERLLRLLDKEPVYLTYSDGNGTYQVERDDMRYPMPSEGATLTEAIERAVEAWEADR